MRQIMRQTEAQIFFNRPTKPIEPGQYEVFGEFEGGVFNPKIMAFDMKPLSSYSMKLIVVEDSYYEHGNGD